MGARVAIRRSRAALYSRRFGAVALPVLALGAVGHRIGVVDTDTLLVVILVGFLLATAAFAAGIYALADIWHSGAQGVGHAFAGLIYAAPALVLLALSLYATAAYPRLADISTDWDDPLRFSAAEDLAPSEDLGAYAAAQNAAYPDVTARLYAIDAEQVFAVAEELVAERGWRVAASFPPEAAGDGGLIEAEARTPIFGFADDVLVRVQGLPEGTRVDVRSRSRIGEHDLSTNARRIRAFLNDLDAALAGVLNPSGGAGAPAAD